jgi:hypothetical protein
MVLDFAAKQTGTGTGAKMTVDSLHGILNGGEHGLVNRRTLIRTLRAFAEAGCGRFFTGRHGQPSRFVWAVPWATMEEAVTGRASAGHSGKTAPTHPALLSAGEAEMFSHPFRLRPGLIISINLPNDLTIAEADRLARFIQALPLSA